MLVSKLHTSYKSIIQLVYFNNPIPKKVSNSTFFGIGKNREEDSLEKSDRNCFKSCKRKHYFQVY